MEPVTTKLVRIPTHCPEMCANRVFKYLGNKRFKCKCGAIFQIE